MKTPTFITGNKFKAEYLSKHLSIDLPHQKIDLDEIQSLDLQEVVDFKLDQAYKILQKPVMVQDLSLGFEELGGLPGTFIRFFVDHTPFEKICAMVGKNRKATAWVIYGYYDGVEKKFFEGGLHGEIASEPRGENGFGWDPIFIPEGYSQTRGEMNEENNKKSYQALHPFEEMKAFFGKE